MLFSNWWCWSLTAQLECSSTTVQSPTSPSCWLQSQFGALWSGVLIITSSPLVSSKDLLSDWHGYLHQLCLCDIFHLLIVSLYRQLPQTAHNYVGAMDLNSFWRKYVFYSIIYTTKPFSYSTIVNCHPCRFFVTYLVFTML